MEAKAIDVAVLGRVGIDLYPNQLRTPLARGAHLHALRRRFRRQRRDGARAARPDSGDRLPGRARSARRVRARLPRRRGRRRALPRGRPEADDAADVLRGLAARPLPDHLLPLPDRAGLAARAGGLRCGRGRGCAASSTRPAPASPSRRAARRRSRRSPRTQGTTIFDLDWRPALWDEPPSIGELAPRPPRRTRTS